MTEKKNKGGLKKGQTNNPNGRPVGSKNKIAISIKEKIVQFVEEDWDTLRFELKGLDPKDRVKAKIDLIKLVVPRPTSEEEKDAFNKMVGGLSRLFPQKEEQE